MKKEDSLFNLQFLKRFSTCPAFLMIFGSLVFGLVAGAMAVKFIGLTDNRNILPLFFSAVPTIDLGFFQCFSDILLNLMIFLIAIFLLGATAFGAVGIPVLMFYKGVTISAAALFFLADGNISRLGGSALCFTPIWAATSLLLTLFSTRALVFSKSLARAGFSQPQETVDFRLYLKDFVYFLCFSVPLALSGGLLAALYVLF